MPEVGAVKVPEIGVGAGAGCPRIVVVVADSDRAVAGKVDQTHGSLRPGDRNPGRRNVRAENISSSGCRGEGCSALLVSRSRRVRKLVSLNHREGTRRTGGAWVRDRDSPDERLSSVAIDDVQGDRARSIVCDAVGSRDASAHEVVVESRGNKSIPVHDENAGFGVWGVDITGV